jgi:hypothetical protein
MNLSYGDSTCLGVGVATAGDESTAGGVRGSVSADLVARRLTFVLILLGPNTCLLARARLPNAVHKDDIFSSF